MYPDRAKEYFTQEEMVGANMGKLASKATNDRKKEKAHKEQMINSVEHTGSASEAIAKAVSAV